MNLLPLPIDPKDFNEKVVSSGLALLPIKMDSTEARCMIIAICLQETNLNARWQNLGTGVKGPARGLAQFEKTGVSALMNHRSSCAVLHDVCENLNIPFERDQIWMALEKNDYLTVAMARLLLFTDKKRLPKLNEPDYGWNVYVDNWRPGRPRKAAWSANFSAAVEAVDRREKE